MLKTLKANKSILIEVCGTVQGLGFRPFVFNLAKKHQLAGYVRNTGFGAEIAIEGGSESINLFVKRLKNSVFEASYKITAVPNAGYKDFEIKKSKKSEITSEFPPDLALCGQCRKELFSKSDRRYKYPFINCVNCGPRFSIINKLPYDRKNTTMRHFKMCPDCLKEYNNPADRRFHAQPNACPECGPQLYLYDGKSRLLALKQEAFDRAVQYLKAGKIVAVKSIGGFHLACDASNIKAVKRLRKRKLRPFKPFALMAAIQSAKKLCFVNRHEQELLLSAKAPIVILKKRGNQLPEVIAPDNNSLGIMMPSAPLHHLLVKEIPVLVMTSGNRADEPISASDKDAFKNLFGIADYFLSNDRDIENRSDDSIVKFVQKDEKILIRRSRGYVPEPVKTGIHENLIAAGGDLKNSFCFVRNGNAYLSQFSGDLAAKANEDFYAENIRKMKSFLNINPKKAVCDAHEGYFSSNYIKTKYKSVKKYFHHYAHIASVMAENGIKDTVIGFSFDGNGYGEDGNIWGGECVLFNGKTFERLLHLDYFNLPGGDICAKEIWRTAVALLYKCGLTDMMPAAFKKYEYKKVLKMLENNINSPKTSSMGRLFDGIAALAGIKYEATFEAEGATALESAITGSGNKSYPYKIESHIIKYNDMIKNILFDVEKRIAAAEISLKFHNTIACMVADAALQCSKKYKTKKIILSGGAFQNTFLLKKIVNRLKSSELQPLFNKSVPVNDGGICIGQAYLHELREK